MKKLFFALAEREYSLESTIENLLVELEATSQAIRYFKGTDEEFDRLDEREEDQSHELSTLRAELEIVKNEMRSIRKETGRGVTGEWRSEFHADARFPQKQTDVTMVGAERVEGTRAHKRMTDIYSN